MIDTIMALWNRMYQRKSLQVLCACLLICISISLLLTMMGGIIAPFSRHGGRARDIVNADAPTATAPSGHVMSNATPTSTQPGGHVHSCPPGNGGITPSVAAGTVTGVTGVTARQPRSVTTRTSAPTPAKPSPIASVSPIAASPTMQPTASPVSAPTMQATGIPTQISVSTPTPAPTPIEAATPPTRPTPPTVTATDMPTPSAPTTEIPTPDPTATDTSTPPPTIVQRLTPTPTPIFIVTPPIPTVIAPTVLVSVVSGTVSVSNADLGSMQLADLADSACMGRNRLTIPLQEQNAAMIEGALAIDLGGALLGTLLFYCVMYVLKRKRGGQSSQ